MSTSSSDVVNWWDAPIAQPYGAATDIYFSNGAQDIEKGNVYRVKAGTPVNLPLSGKIVWEDAQHMVVQTSKGFLNFLHINPTIPTGAQVAPGQTIGEVSNLVGNSGTLPDGHFYVETGNVLEAGLYSDEQTAINRDNYVNRVDQPHDFTNIENPNALFGTFDALWKAHPGSARGVTGGNPPSQNGDIHIQVGPWPVTIPNPTAGIENAVGTGINNAVGGVEGAVGSAVHTAGQTLARYALAAGLAAAGLVLIVLAFKKQIASTVATAVAP